MGRARRTNRGEGERVIDVKAREKKTTRKTKA